jgi:hypothetical protein
VGQQLAMQAYVHCSEGSKAIEMILNLWGIPSWSFTVASCRGGGVSTKRDVVLAKQKMLAITPKRGETTLFSDWFEYSTKLPFNTLPDFDHLREILWNAIEIKGTENETLTEIIREASEQLSKLQNRSEN